MSEFIAGLYWVRETMKPLAVVANEGYKHGNKGKSKTYHLGYLDGLQDLLNCIDREIQTQETGNKDHERDSKDRD